MHANANRIDAIYADISGTTHTLRLAEILRDASRLFTQGIITEREYEEVNRLIADQRAKTPARQAQSDRRFARRARQRSPDREKSRERRRMLGSSSAMPPKMRSHYTEGERSVLCIIAMAIKRHGVCDFPIDKIAALAGVCRTTVQNAIHEARRLGHLQVTERPQLGKKNLTNIVFASAEWKTWITRGPTIERVTGSKNFFNTREKSVSATRLVERKRERWDKLPKSA